ncbi:hypothetical protein [Cupriavidus sp. IDO]|uniref:hypothetical protein n=1 Tax=Cupriavidus sp. IDO TaxID=1539142 RepID=UPI0012699EE1|nr:hypothetical protein [Cupriavidus sp. IDO]
MDLIGAHVKTLKDYPPAQKGSSLTQVWSTRVAPICAPRCLGSAAMVRRVSAATSNSLHDAAEVAWIAGDQHGA